MRIAALAVALFAIAIGVVGIVSPDRLTTARRHLMEYPDVLYFTAPIRLTMGIVLILAARKSRTPRMLRVLGVVMALQGIVPLFLGIDRARMILQQEESFGVAVLRIGAVIALATGCFIAFVVMARPKIS